MKNYIVRTVKQGYLLIIVLGVLPFCISCDCSNLKGPDNKLVKAFHGDKFVRMDRFGDRDGGAYSSSSRLPDRSTDIWNCGNCQFRNTSFRHFCQACGINRQQGSNHNHSQREDTIRAARSENAVTRETTPREATRNPEAPSVGLQNMPGMGAQTSTQANGQAADQTTTTEAEDGIEGIIKDLVKDIIDQVQGDGHVTADAQHEHQPQDTDDCCVCIDNFNTEKPGEKAIKCTNQCAYMLCEGCYAGMVQEYVKSRKAILCPICRAKMPLRSDLIEKAARLFFTSEL